MFGTGFEPEEDDRSRFARALRLPGFESADRSLGSRSCSRRMRGTGFEPTDPYGIAS
ncbi:hypothetical protein NJ7G_1472 [Natrinema sp. J7-2]|nr:hypothetical protein NJ7G_1472 [Natrinema sp. J7-2]